ncbi:hypothetical protein [Kluyvera intermedia]|uniref:Uncharacterized protein n=1 Tax=Kluyvera intermedia TaxID=61648 RepID=A0AA95JVX9_KLUIN|nr:hypothetical protein [Kluyvera intermedia]WGL57634.1 hypothetical protein QBD33_07625 [Kluyvera intermedia]
MLALAYFIFFPAGFPPNNYECHHESRLFFEQARFFTLLCGVSAERVRRGNWLQGNRFDDCAPALKNIARDISPHLHHAEFLMTMSSTL